MELNSSEAAMHVTMSDIQKLAGNTSPEARASVAGKVAATLSAGAFNARESQVATEILRVLVRDTEKQVRVAIATQLCHALDAPRDVVQQLIADEDDVAVPLLKYSHVLTEEELIELVRSTRAVAKLVAVAERENISTELTGALLDTNLQKVMKTVLSNRGAMLRDEQLTARWEQIAENASLLEVLVKRGGLSAPIAEKLYSVASDELKNRIAKQYHLPMVVVEEASDDAREWATLGMTMTDVPHSTERQIEKLVDHLYANNRLTYSLVIRSLCIGDLSFFEAALAKFANISRANARILMFDSGPLGFKALFEKARLPEGFYDALHVLLRISLEETGYGRFKRDDFRKQVIARIQSAGYDRTIDNMQYLLTIIGGNVAVSETVH